MMLSRRIASASPGARGSFVRNPSPSGPRCCMAAAITRTRASASPLRLEKTTPHIPHTRLLDLRRGEKRGAGTDQGGPQMESWNVQTLVGVPAKKHPEQQQKQRSQGG